LTHDVIVIDSSIATSFRFLQMVSMHLPTADVDGKWNWLLDNICFGFFVGSRQLITAML